MVPVVILWGIFAVWSLWLGFREDDWSLAQLVWGLFGALVVAAGVQGWWERRRLEGARERRIELHMAEELAVLRLVADGALTAPPVWAVDLLESAAWTADKEVAEVFDPEDEDEDETDFVAAWRARTERNVRVDLVRRRAERVYPSGRL